MLVELNIYGKFANWGADVILSSWKIILYKDLLICPDANKPVIWNLNIKVHPFE